MKTLKNIDELGDLKGFTLLDFSALWCKPCIWMIDNVVGPKIEKIFPTIDIILIDVDDFPDFSYKKHKVPAVPTFILLKDGEEVDRVLGAREGILIEMLQKKVNS